MKIPAIKKLVETQTLSNLKEAEEAISEELPLKIEVEGDDEGEQLTHVIAAIWILEKMQSDGLEFKDALREYTKKVRQSIN
jgi:hypothetical protein